MPKSRNRSRDAKKRAQKKRLKREKLARDLARIANQSTAMLNAAERLRPTNEG